MDFVLSLVKFQWGFPLLSYIGKLTILSELDQPFTVIAFAVFLVFGLVSLVNSALKGYLPDDARLGFIALGAALVVWVTGVVSIVLLAVAVALLWYGVWRWLIYWVLWRVFLKNIPAALSHKQANHTGGGPSTSV